jgi:hypothetical protein
MMALLRDGLRGAGSRIQGHEEAEVGDRRPRGAVNLCESYAIRAAGAVFRTNPLSRRTSGHIMPNWLAEPRRLMVSNMPDEGGPWFTRGQRVRYGDRVGVVQSSFLNGIHYVLLEDERRIIAVPGNMLAAVERKPGERP